MATPQYAAADFTSTVSPTHRCGSGHIGVAVNRYAEEEGYSDADDIDGDTPLADVLEFSQATIVAPPVLVEVNRTAAKKVEHAVDKENKYMQSSLVVTDKTRWYSSALAKAAHLDGFRHLHLKIKVNANQKSRSKKQTPVNKSDSRKSRRRGRSSSNERSPVPTAAAVSAVANATITSPGTQDKLVRQRRKKTFRFNEAVAVYETWDRDAYDRKGMPLTRLDTEQLEIIKEELNTFKMHEMYVHEDSRANTHIIC
ncbi:hypothetical protein EV178_004996 [Coemansia sp. RSA 1646]|nr:hypothetical protein EV178_004996 [Coemansia sp. RSA 1646]